MGRQAQDSARRWSRRRGWRAAAALLAASTLAAGFGACGDDDDESASSTTAASGAAGAGGASLAEVAGWHTWILSSPDQIEVPEPPGDNSAERKAEMEEVEKLAGQRTAEVEAQVARWSGEIITEPWTVINNEYIASKPKDPPMSGRNLSYTHAAMYDALV
ncbi:MAG: hypothetical protein ACRD0S_04445, partial [Acidimicrobiales bacterium]